MKKLLYIILFAILIVIILYIPVIIWHFNYPWGLRLMIAIIAGLGSSILTEMYIKN